MKNMIARTFRFLMVPVLASFFAAPAIGGAKAEDALGPVTKLPLPRYVSLRYEKTNVREGPSKQHRTTWIYQHAGLPVEITAEFDTWRRIRDSEGAEGWVLQSLLVGKRTALVAPWKKGEIMPLYTVASETGGVAARLQTGVLAAVRSCDGQWCRLTGSGFDGFMKQANLWGVYPDEKF